MDVLRERLVERSSEDASQVIGAAGQRARDPGGAEVGLARRGYPGGPVGARSVVLPRGVRLKEGSRREPMELRWPTWIGVVVDDLEKQRRFYRDTLGFRETGSSEGWVHMEFPSGGLFELIQRDLSPQYEATRYQVGFTVEDVQATREELIRRGVEPISEIEGQESGSSNMWCYFRDAENNVFEITQWLQARDQ
jgi:catechol 2,3-dioxygenase-like lactoylglutathione lyase family enzyme